MAATRRRFAMTAASSSTLVRTFPIPRIRAYKISSLIVLISSIETLQVSLNNYWRGHWPQHPVQLHLHGLPEDVVVKVIADFVEEHQTPDRPIKNYADWLFTSFGRTFAELFPMQYTRKYHTTTADNMTTDWLGPRIYRPSLEEVLRGALSSSSPTVHYITHFRYPSEGGFVSYLNKFVPLGNLNLNHELVSIDPRARQLRFSNGHEAHYDALISSVPLPDLVRMIDGAPPDVLDAVGRLACSTCVVVNVGVNREDLSRAHVTYFYDEDICFTRLGFPHMLAASNAPPGTGSIQAEIYFSEKYKPFTGSPDDWIEPVIRDLRRCGYLREDDRLLCRARCCSHTPTSSSTSTVRLHSRLFTAISMISVSPIAGAMETGATCGRTRASRAGSWPPNGLYRCGPDHKARKCRLGVEWELAKREKELLWLRPSKAEPELTKSRGASTTGPLIARTSSRISANVIYELTQSRP